MINSKTSLSDMIFWVSPHKIRYCTPSSKYADLNQHEKDKDHPHAFFDRGYFFEKDRKGLILDGDWDNVQLEFESLLEYQALQNHINGSEKWSLSEFADRTKKYMSMDNKESSGATYRFKNFNSPTEFIDFREKEIDILIENINKEGIVPEMGLGSQISGLDDISVNISKEGYLLFNNRGHHRLSIGKILNLSLVPIQMIVWHKSIFCKYDTI